MLELLISIWLVWDIHKDEKTRIFFNQLVHRKPLFIISGLSNLRVLNPVRIFGFGIEKKHSPRDCRVMQL